MNTTYMKRGDTFPSLETTLKDENGPVRLVGAVVTCRISKAGTGNIGIERQATIVYPQTGSGLGKCFHEFLPEDTCNVGTYIVEWHVLFANGLEATFPRSSNPSDFNILIIQEIIG